MSDSHWLALAGCLLSAFLFHDLVRRSAGFRGLTFTREHQPARYWAYLSFTAWVTALIFISAFRTGDG